MAWLSLILVLVGGILAAAPSIIGKKPEAKEYIDKIRPAQGWIGVVLVIFGIINLIQVLPVFGFLFRHWIGMVTLGMIFIGMLANGFILGYELIVQFTMSGSEAAQEKADSIRKKLAPIQVSLGFAAIGMCITLLFAYLGIIRMF